MSPNNAYDKIEAYLLNELSEHEREAFEMELSTNVELVKEVELHRVEHDAMELLIAEETKQQFKAWLDEGQAPATATPTPQKDNSRWLFMGVLLVGLLAIAAYLLFSDKEQAPDNQLEKTSVEVPIEVAPIERPAMDTKEKAAPSEVEELEQAPNKKESTGPIAKEGQQEDSSRDYLAIVNNVYATPPMQLAMRSGNQEVLQQIQDNFDNKQFGVAIQLLKEQENISLKALEMLGHAHLSLQEFEEAKAAFQTILDANDPALADEVTAYYLLACVGQGQVEQASFKERVSAVLADEEHPSFELVNKIIGALELNN
ncbi:MAG: hypothetical protein AAF798_07650 [Bacteroidota bacterium]